MALIKSNVFFTSLLVLVALFGVFVGGTIHQVGDSKGWTIMGVDYAYWVSSRTFQVGDSLIFQYHNEYHDVTQVTSNEFELCDPSKPSARYQTGSDVVTLTKPGVHNFICGVPGHCNMGLKVQILVLPASLGPIAAPLPRPARSPNSYSSPSPSSLVESPVGNAPQYQMGPSPASTLASWISFSSWF